MAMKSSYTTPRDTIPGVSFTGLARHLTQNDIAALSEKITADRTAAGLGVIEFKTVQQAAATSVWGATAADSQAIGGHYLQDCQVAPVDDTPGFGDGVRSYAVNPERAKQLWIKSEGLVGEQFHQAH